MADVVFCLRNTAARNLHNSNELAKDRVSAGVLNILQTALKMFNLFFFPHLFHHLQFIFLHGASILGFINTTN